MAAAISRERLAQETARHAAPTATMAIAPSFGRLAGVKRRRTRARPDDRWHPRIRSQSAHRPAVIRPSGVMALTIPVRGTPAFQTCPPALGRARRPS